ncbi:3'-5' exonuclease-like [Nymphaea colorata]|uniref:3'-5' exonuclease domain-containing protein n=1 Tax=Nymphaea colorata TaxID=210225 RepID=A0A5K0XC32_9MAGN|nr:3'-5' exonuclease-like [Nymphaea colorata]
MRRASTTFVSNNGFRNAPFSSSSSSSLTSTHWINVDGRTILTTVTSDPRVIDDWFGGVMSKTYRRGLVVGLDCEWKPNFIRGQSENKVSILQLCVGAKCLIVQLLYLNCSQSLTRFLMHPAIVFVGVGIQGDVDKLRRDYGIEVGPQRFDLGELASSTMTRFDLRNMGLKILAREVLGLEISKPRSITLSNWSVAGLTERQIEYACVDAYVSFAIGMRLLTRHV